MTLNEFKQLHKWLKSKGCSFNKSEIGKERWYCYFNGVTIMTIYYRHDLIGCKIHTLSVKYDRIESDITKGYICNNYECAKSCIERNVFDFWPSSMRVIKNRKIIKRMKEMEYDFYEAD